MAQEVPQGDAVALSDLVEEPQDDINVINASRKKGKVISCINIDDGDGEGVRTLNGEVKLLVDGNTAVDKSLSADNITFHASTRLQLEANDLISFEIQYYEGGRPYATAIKIIKFGGQRHTAHLEQLAAEILRCQVNHNNKPTEVAVSSKYCVNACKSELRHSSKIEFSLNFDDRSTLWTARRIVLLSNAFGDISLDPQSSGIQSHSEILMDSLHAHRGDADELKEDAVSNNPTDIVWDEDNERKFRNAKTSINYTSNIYIDLPFDADDALKQMSVRLKDLRPYRSNERMSDARQASIKEAQHHCLFLLIRHYVSVLIRRRTAVPLFVKSEPLYETYFTGIVADFHRTEVRAPEADFDVLVGRLRDVVFLPKISMKSNTSNAEDYKKTDTMERVREAEKERSEETDWRTAEREEAMMSGRDDESRDDDWDSDEGGIYGGYDDWEQYWDTIYG